MDFAGKDPDGCARSRPDAVRPLTADNPTTTIDHFSVDENDRIDARYIISENNQFMCAHRRSVRGFACPPDFLKISLSLVMTLATQTSFGGGVQLLFKYIFYCLPILLYLLSRSTCLIYYLIVCFGINLLYPSTMLSCSPCPLLSYYLFLSYIPFILFFLLFSIPYHSFSQTFRTLKKYSFLWIDGSTCALPMCFSSARRPSS